MNDRRDSKESLDLTILFREIDALRVQLDRAMEAGDGQAAEKIVQRLRLALAQVDDMTA